MKFLKPAKKPQLIYTPYDNRYPLIAGKLKREIDSLTKVFEVEHIGSTAVPGAGGKRIIDLIAVYNEGALEETKEILLSIGFCKQGKEFSHLWPEHRPMYLGNYNFDQDTFLVYIHVVQKDNDETHRFRIFIERLRENPKLLKEYCDVKQSIIYEGVRDSDEYTKRKIPIIKKILGSNYTIKK